MSHPQPPFHRRILPWLFFAMFLALAPVLVYYTAGYRYNAKKGQFERNGTLIVDSTPSGARIVIDGQDTNETTPVTLQNIPTGSHHVLVHKDGYRDWQKDLEIRPEQVTFANAVWLWKINEPAVLLPGDYKIISADPLNQKLALVAAQSPAVSTLSYWSPASGLASSSTFAASAADSLLLRWQNDGNAVLLNGFSIKEKTWWSKPVTARPFVDPLPTGTYHWSGTDLLGENAPSSFRLVPQSKTFAREPLAPRTIGIAQDLTLQFTSSSEEVLADRSLRTRLFSMPAGQWSFGEIRKPYVLLQDSRRWLAINLEQSDPYVGQVTGDQPRWLTGSNPPTALFVNDREVWMWKMGNDPVLLWRQSDPIRQVAWHRGGTAVFIADEHQIFTLELDDRNGRQVTQLATFDHLEDFGIVNRTLYIAAQKGTQRGLWQVNVE